MGLQPHGSAGDGAVALRDQKSFGLCRPPCRNIGRSRSRSAGVEKQLGGGLQFCKWLIDAVYERFGKLEGFRQNGGLAGLHDGMRNHGPGAPAAHGGVQFVNENRGVFEIDERDGGAPRIRASVAHQTSDEAVGIIAAVSLP